MLSAYEGTLLKIFETIHIVHFVLSLFLQAILFILMVRSTSKTLRDMRLYLINTLFLQFITGVTAFFSQCRAVPNYKTVGMMCSGYCKNYGSASCYFLFLAVQSTIVACASSLILAFYYRYKLLIYGGLTKWQHYRLFFVSYSIPLFYMATMFIAPSDESIILEEIKMLHPTYDIENYAIIGFTDVYGPFGITNTIMLSFGFYGAPIIAYVYRRKILRILNTRHKNNKLRIENSKSMILGLTIQTVMPLICYMPVLTYYMYSQYSGNSSLLTEFITSPLGYIYTITDPISTIYFVLPYRRAFIGVFKKWPNFSKQGPVTINQSDSNSRMFRVS